MDDYEDVQVQDQFYDATDSSSEEEDSDDDQEQDKKVFCFYLIFIERRVLFQLSPIYHNGKF